MTLGTAKTATMGRVLNSATTEDGSGFYSVDTTTASFTTTLAPAVQTGEQLRFKQANGSWATNPWTLTSSATGGLKFLTTAGVSSAVTSLALSSRNVGEVVAEWDGSFWQVSQLAAALGGFAVSQALSIATQNTIPALASAWNGTGVPTLDINGVIVPNGTVASTTATAASTTTSISVASATGISVGQAVSGTGVTAGTTVTAISGTTITVSQAVNIANAAALTFTSAAIFTSGSTAVTVNQYALGFNVNVGDNVTAFYTT